MVTTWKHPDLGTFHHDGFAWIREVSLPAFEVFSLRARRRSAKPALMFDIEEETEVPTREMVAVAKRILGNGESLVEKVLKALWLDFNGRGPGSGMWWNGNLADVTKYILDPKTKQPIELGEPSDIAPLMRLMSMRIAPEHREFKKPLAELAFRAEFEIEHGVEILPDGSRVLGIGRIADAQLFAPVKKLLKKKVAKKSKLKRAR